MSRTLVLAAACAMLVGSGIILLLWPVEKPRVAQPPSHSNLLYDPR